MRKLFLISLFSCFVILSCSKSDKYNSQNFETKYKDLFFVSDDNLILKNWVDYYKKLDSKFSLNKFEFTSKKALIFRKGNVYGIFDKKFDKIYTDFLIFNKAKDKYLDFDSYNWNLADGKINFALDQEINLVDISKKSIERIDFLGSSVWVENAYWKNDDILVLLENSENRKPIISEINFKTKEIKNFIYQDTLKIESHFSQERIHRILKNGNFW